MWPVFKDLLIIYVLLTPTAVLFWRSTDILLNTWLGHNTRTIVVGFVSSVTITYFHDFFRKRAPTSRKIALYTYETIYDYMVTVSGVCYALGCQTVCELLLKTRDLVPSHVAAFAGLVLILLHGFRNVMSLPLVVHNDNALDRYRPLSFLVFTNSQGTFRKWSYDIFMFLARILLFDLSKVIRKSSSWLREGLWTKICDHTLTR